MKTAKSFFLQSCVAGALLLLAPKSEALTTPYLSGLSNDLAAYQALLASSPAPEDQRKARVLVRALRDLKPATSTVAQDYTRYHLAMRHLGDHLFTDSTLTVGGVTAFQFFMVDAAAQIDQLSVRTNALSPFVRTRRAASAQIDEAYALLRLNIATASDLSKTNLQAGLLRGARIFSKLVVAERLIVRGEASRGFAPESGAVVGGVFDYNGGGESGTITLAEASEYTDANAEETVGGNYIYARTGLNTSTLVLSQIGGGVTTLRLTFRSGEQGGYAYTFEAGPDRGRGAGRFTYTAPPGGG